MNGHFHAHGRRLVARVELNAAPERAPRVFPLRRRARGAIHQDSAAINVGRGPPGRTFDALCPDCSAKDPTRPSAPLRPHIRRVDEEHIRTPNFGGIAGVKTVLHNEVPGPSKKRAGMIRLEEDHHRGGLVERGRVGPLQEERAVGPALGVRARCIVEVDLLDERRVAGAVCPAKEELLPDVEWPAVPL